MAAEPLFDVVEGVHVHIGMDEGLVDKVGQRLHKVPPVTCEQAGIDEGGLDRLHPFKIFECDQLFEEVGEVSFFPGGAPFHAVQPQRHDEDVLSAVGIDIGRIDAFHGEPVAVDHLREPVEEIVLGYISPGEDDLQRGGLFLLFPVFIAAHLVLAVIPRFGAEVHIEGHD